MGKRHSLIVPGYFDKIRDVCQFVLTGATAAGFAEDELFRLELACDEACTNVIEHAYGGEGLGDLAVSYEMGADHFIIIVEDVGRSFDPEAIEAPEIPQRSADLEKLPVGGLGLHIIRQVMDEIEFRFAPDRNILLMRKTLPGDGAT